LVGDDDARAGRYLGDGLPLVSPQAQAGALLVVEHERGDLSAVNEDAEDGALRQIHVAYLDLELAAAELDLVPGAPRGRHAVDGSAAERRVNLDPGRRAGRRPRRGTGSR
jgi:hypothetical protein